MTESVVLMTPGAALGCNTCVKPADPCNPCGTKTMGAWSGWVGAIVLYLILLGIFWVIFYYAKPSYVVNADGTVNVGKVWASAAIAALIALIIIVLLVWLFVPAMWSR